MVRSFDIPQPTVLTNDYHEEVMPFGVVVESLIRRAVPKAVNSVESKVCTAV